MTKLLAVLTVALSLYTAAVVVEGSTVSLKATPASIEPLVSKDLTLVCRLSDAPRDDTHLDFASAMTITHDDQVVAKISAHHPAAKYGNSTGVVSGNFTGKTKDGYLQISWQYPGDDETGQYTCRVSGTDRQGFGATVLKTLGIEKKNIGYQQLISHVHDLQAAVDKLIATTAQQHEVNTKLKSENAQQQTQITQAKTSISQLTQALSAVNETSLHVETGEVQCNSGFDTGSGRREDTCDVTFSKPYTSPPAVMVSPIDVKSTNTNDAGYWIKIPEITTTGFKIKTIAYDGSHIKYLYVRWMSVANA